MAEIIQSTSSSDHHLMPKVITFLSNILQGVADNNDATHIGHQKISIFHGLSRPNISVEGYLERIFQYANCSSSCFIVAYIYLDRFSRKQPFLPINSFNIHRLIIASVLVATKFLDDIYYNNAYYAKVGGISTVEMNFLELDFLFGIEFQLNVNPTTFYTYCSYIDAEMLLRSPPLELLPTTMSSNIDENLHWCTSEDEQTNSHHQESAV